MTIERVKKDDIRKGQHGGTERSAILANGAWPKVLTSSLLTLHVECV